ncbi:NahK/ErcS family hybrid sensor histidine kinase/response regulator [Pinisolibacter aquiterrae]|uniref:NahK/ErcS family hybrid sensor histidine kinase/response regulator n=1 Tax=Pinisolibacter aquiterrae TaxID=2815579 RepID=UPI001C3C7497|nr:NahK/ErcS family hybrid sensor histidine kinase/response regulator [Pinisolibacter aquiterrae]MBV5262736.1 response regulator [Pinisolibacter aquiterrae]MCC8233556.1 response regulator [Pinisolibacter aquiterrae]
MTATHPEGARRGRRPPPAAPPPADPPAPTTDAAEIARLEARIAKLEKINAVLIDRVERSVDSQANAFSLFQTTIGLERQVRLRTDELMNALRKVEQMNEQLLVAKDMAERANRSKTRFLAQAGHDLLQPLAAARLSSSALAELQKDADGRRLSRQVERALATIEGLLKTLLDISRLDAGVMVPQITSVGLGQLFADLVTDHAPVAERRGLRLTMMPSSAHVSTDPIMLTRILQNLIGNALRYTERGRVLVGARRRGRRVRIDVIDTGPGISEDQYATVFEEFHRGRGQTQDGEVGLGLGLSIVQRLADVLDHTVTLTSRVGRGTRFSIEIERADRPPTPTFSPAAVNALGRPGWGMAGALVAVIDNDPAVREATVELVRQWGCEAIPAAGAAGIIALVEENARRPDLLLVDYHLDDETGVEAIATMTEAWDQEVPAIVITADYGREIEERLAANGLELMRKPVKPAELRALMAHLLA